MDKNRFNQLLAKWIKWDGELWAELTELQLKLLFERIVKEISYNDLGKMYNVPGSKIKEIFGIILFKIEKSHGKELGKLLREIESSIEKKSIKKDSDDGDFNIEKVWLN